MSIKNVYEVFEEFKAASGKNERLAVLQTNDSYALRQILLGTFNKNVVFDVEIPKFNRQQMPAGMSYSHMTDALSRVYLFVEGNAKRPPALTKKRQTEILIQILESLEEKEADVFAGMLKKDLKVPYLTPALVGEAFPGLL
jgi:hypothetical protein